MQDLLREDPLVSAIEDQVQKIVQEVRKVFPEDEEVEIPDEDMDCPSVDPAQQVVKGSFISKTIDI